MNARKFNYIATVTAIVMVASTMGCSGFLEWVEEDNQRAAQQRESRQAAAAAERQAHRDSDKLGTRGPAGGIIFYDKGNRDGGWQYLEVAPVEAEFTAAWGGKGHSMNHTGRNVGDGFENSRAAVAQFGGREPGGRTDYAAKQASELSFGGHSDWFIPSIRELDLIRTRVYGRGMGDFRTRSQATSNAYQSSTEDTAETMVAMLFGHSGWTGSRKDAATLVRPIRRF